MKALRYLAILLAACLLNLGTAQAQNKKQVVKTPKAATTEVEKKVPAQKKPPVKTVTPKIAPEKPVNTPVTGEQAPEMDKPNKEKKAVEQPIEKAAPVRNEPAQAEKAPKQKLQKQQ